MVLVLNNSFDLSAARPNPLVVSKDNYHPAISVLLTKVSLLTSSIKIELSLKSKER